MIQPNVLDYYDGPSDPAEMRLYLNTIIRALNLLTEWVLTPGGQPLPISQVVTAGGVSWDGTTVFVPISSASGNLEYYVPAGFGIGDTAKQVIIFKIGTDSNSVTVRDAPGGNVLAFLSSSGQAFAVCASAASSVYAGYVT